MILGDFTNVTPQELIIVTKHAFYKSFLLSILLMQVLNPMDSEESLLLSDAKDFPTP